MLLSSPARNTRSAPLEIPHDSRHWRKLDSSVPVYNFKPLENQLGGTLSPERLENQLGGTLSPERLVAFLSTVWCACDGAGYAVARGICGAFVGFGILVLVFCLKIQTEEQSMVE
jgi:hypothetical protein